MAFVCKSPKKSLFQIDKNYEQTSTSIISTQQRVHHIDKHEQQKWKKSMKKTNQLSKFLSNLSSQPSIPNNQKKYQIITQQVNNKKRYNFRLISKYRPVYPLNQSSHTNSVSNCKQQKQQLCTAPSSLKPKSMVKYMKKMSHKLQTQRQQHRNKFKIEGPGPGAYSPATIDPKIHTPKFVSNVSTKLSIRNSQQDEQRQVEQSQNLFAVKYNFMNSSTFKSSPNLLRLSNKNLLTRIFHKKQSINAGNYPQTHYNTTKNEQNQLNKQYITVEDTTPGPGTYKCDQKSKNDAAKFGSSKRFQKIVTDGPNKFYYNSGEDEKQEEYNCQTPCFSSLVKRFEEKKKVFDCLQHSNYQKALIKQSKNKKRIPFDSTITRSLEPKIDKRPYYSLKPLQKAQFMAKFSKYQSKRILFQTTNSQTPSPSDYNVSPQWIKQHSCIIKKQSNQRPTLSNQKQNRQQLIKFIFCSQNTLSVKKQNESDGSNKKDKQKRIPKLTKLSNTAKIDQIKAKLKKSKQQQTYMYYNIAQNWQTKSFNTNFSNQILPANNPVKNKLL